MNKTITKILKTLGFNNDSILEIRYAGEGIIKYKAFEQEHSYTGLPVIMVGRINENNLIEDESENMELSTFILLLD